jgi:outer membrane lipoprotein-sorting protein
MPGGRGAGASGSPNTLKGGPTMRWLLTMAVAAVAVPAYAGENDAEKLFRQMEKKIQTAKTVQVRFDATISIFGMGGSIKGTAVHGDGDNMRVDADVAFADKKTKATLIGNGTKVFTKDSEKPAIDTKDSPKGLGNYLRSVLPRVGVFPGLDEITKGNELPKIDDIFKVSDFKLGAKEKVGSAETRVVEYTVLVRGKDKAAAKVWINTQTNLPAKLELRMESNGIAVELSETYAEFAIDGKVDSKLFEMPK